jgi:hypothetical protein
MLPFCLKAVQKYVFQPENQKKISAKTQKIKRIKNNH